MYLRNTGFVFRLSEEAQCADVESSFFKSNIEKLRIYLMEIRFEVRGDQRVLGHFQGMRVINLAIKQVMKKRSFPDCHREKMDSIFVATQLLV